MCDDSQTNPADAPGVVREVPPSVRVELLHAYVQLLADQHGWDVLHLKGPAVHPDLRGATARVSLDVDVLVRPDHVQPLLDALADLGWHKVTGFEDGSAFGHATNMRHALGLIDLHRRWPGFDIPPNEAFEALWAERGHLEIAGVTCSVPSVEDQRVVLLLHHARSGGRRDEDVLHAWSRSDDATRERVRRRASDLHADLALAAATGELERFRDRPGYRLWRHFSRGEVSRWAEWRARYEAAPGCRAKRSVLLRLLRVNHDLLASDLGHEPTRLEYAEAYGRRVRIALVDAARSVHTFVRGRRR